MTKPTLMQSLLNQPSQSYSHPIKHDYHSTKQEMLRIAADQNTATRTPDKHSMPQSYPKQHRPSSPPTTYRRATSRLSYNEFEFLEPSEESDLDDLFFTPNTSPRTSMASSLLMFPTARKPSRKSLRLSDASDIVVLPAAAPPTPATAAGRAKPGGQPSPPPVVAVLSTRTPSTTPSSSHHHSSAHNRHQNDSQNQRTTSLEPGSGHQLEFGNDKRKGKEGTKNTRHGTVTLKPNTVVVPSTITTITQKTTTTSKRKTSQGPTDGDLTKDVKRPVPQPVPAPTPASSTLNGVTVKTTVTTTTSPSGSNTASATIGSPHVLASRKSSKTKPPANPGAAASSKEKEKAKQDMVVEPEAPSASKTKEKEKEKDLDTSTSKSRTKDKGKEKAKTTSMPTSDGNAVIPEQSINTPKTTTPHTFSAFAPLVASNTPSAASPPEKTNGNANAFSQDKPPLPPAGFSFPPPPLHSPQQHKNSLNGSAAAYTYAHRHKGSSIPKVPNTVGGSSIMMNMTALLEEDEIDGNGDESTQTRRLRHTTNTNGIVKGKGKRGSFDSMSSVSDSSHHSQSRSPPQSDGNSNSIPNSNSNSNATTSQSKVHSESSTFRSPPKTLSSEVNAMSLSTPGELPSKGTQGYSSLVLPRAPLPLGSHSTSIRTASTSGSGSQRKWFGGKEGKIDLTRTGVAQTTMASVEVVRGLGRQQGQNFGGKLLGMFGRKRSLSSSGRDAGPKPIEGLGNDTRIVNEDLPSKGNARTTAGVEGTVLGFTSYRKPPGYVPSNSVLVQVWAVGVDGVDGRLVGLRFGDHVWSRVREKDVTGGGGSGYEEEGRVETEWEREREEGNEENEEMDVSKSTPQQNSNKGFAGLGRSFSLRMPRTKQQDHQRVHGLPQQPSRSNTDPLQPQQNTFTTSTSQKQVHRPKVLEKKQKRVPHKAEVGYIPGRSFVGRVLECGWDVRDEVVRKGEWVIGLLDVKKCGALTEFIVVDRHRIHRVPHPRKVPQQGNGHLNAATEADVSLPFQDDGSNMSALTLEELALLPLCGIPAYRAVRTFIYAFSSLREGIMASPTTGTADGDRKGGGGVEFGSKRSSKLTTEHPQDRRRRVLVLRGHDGVGAMAVQMLAQRGWKVSVHVPFSSSLVSDSQPITTTEAEHDSFPRDIQERARDWGADEIIFDEEAGGGIDDGRIAAIRVIESLREDGDVFDAILDTVGGKEVREAGERLLRSAGVGGGGEPMSPRTPNKAKGVGQFTTLVGDVPERPIPTAGDNFRAGLRSLRFGSSDAGGAGNVDAGGNGDEGSADMKGNKVGYAWVSVAQDVDWEGEDIGDTLASVLRLALEDGVRPVIGDDVDNHHRVMPFEKVPYAFVDKGPLGHGRNVVVKIAG